MSETTRKIMRKFRNQLTRYVDIQVTSCGHLDEMNRAADMRVLMEFELQEKIEELVRKAGLP